MNVYEIYKSAIEVGGYSISQMEERIETVYACGKITKEERAELIDLVSDKGDHLDNAAIMDKLADIESRLSVLESSGVKVWVSGMVCLPNLRYGGRTECKPIIASRQTELAEHR